MDEFNESTVNAEPVEVVEPQEAEQVETTESVVGEVATPQENKPVQSAEENSVYASIRREAEAKAQDKLIAEMYGESHGIYTKADYDKAVQAQQAEEQRQEYEKAGLNSDMINKIINDNPTVKQANEIIAKQKEEARINSEVQDLFQEFPEARESKIPDSVFMESIEKGIPLTYAYAKYATKNALNIAEQKALRGITQNAQTSPGALNGDNSTRVNTISNMSKADFQRMQNEVLRGERKQI